MPRREITLTEKLLVPGALIESSRRRWKDRSTEGLSNMAKYLADTTSSIFLDLFKLAPVVIGVYYLGRYLQQ